MFATNPSSLVNRKDLEDVGQFIDNSGYYYLLNIFASKGFGKSSLLTALLNEYQNKLPISLIHIADYASTEGGYRLDQLLARITTDLNSYLPNKNVIKDSTANEAESVTELAAQIVKIVDELTTLDKTIVLLIDDYDQLPYGPRGIFEDIVISKVVDKPRQTRVILTSGHEISFTDRLDLRVRLKTLSLNTLAESDIRLRIPDKIAIAPAILKWSGGIPDLADFLIDKTNSENINNIETYNLHEKELLGKEYRSRIWDVLFSDVQALSEDVIDIVSLLRRFDVAILSTILPKIKPEEFKSFKQKHYFDLIRSLGDRVYWRDQGGYVLNSVLRGMLSSYMRGFEPTLYEKVNDITATTYEEWLKEEFRVHYLTEMLYHKMLVQKYRKTEDDLITTFISDSILNFVEGREKTSPKPFDGLDELNHILRDDSALGPYVKQEVFDAIEKHIIAAS